MWPRMATAMKDRSRFWTKTSHLPQTGAIDLSPDDYMFDFTAAIRDADFDRMGLWHKFPGHRLSADIDARFSGNGTDSADGSIVISRLNFTVTALTTGCTLAQ